MIYTDTHCHLGSVQFDRDRDEVIQRMLEADVCKAILICCSEHDLQEGIRLRNRYPEFKLACGIHPQSLMESDGEERFVHFQNAVQECRPDMIGEIGLDYQSHRHTKEIQKAFFEKQLEYACQLDLPLNIHSRKAVLDTQQMLRKYPCRGIIHSYSGSAETAREYVREGWYISFGASVLFPGARKPAEAVRAVPADHLLIETDAPYQSPVPGKRHEPADAVRICRKISDIKGIPEEELCRIMEDNFRKLFRE